MTEGRICRFDRPRPFGLAVPSDRGIFAWQDFTRLEYQHDVPEWAWKACQKGPFTTPFSKAVFLWHLFWVKMKGHENPIHAAGWRSMGVISLRYFDAYSEIETTWKRDSLGFSLIAIQESNFEINYYPCES